jgi:hypothetical protein
LLDQSILFTFKSRTPGMASLKVDVAGQPAQLERQASGKGKQQPYAYEDRAERNEHPANSHSSSIFGDRA